MKLVIAGSRTFKDYDLLKSILSTNGVTEVVSGAANGADKLGEKWAVENNIPIRQFHAEWGDFGKKAGMIRNNSMGLYCDEAVIFWDGQSRGSKNMIEVMERFKKPFKVVRF